MLIAVTLALGVEPELLPDAPLAGAPFGVALYAWGEPGRGVAYSLTQGVGVAGGIYASIQASTEEDAGNDTEAEAWEVGATSAIALAAVSYIVSVLDGSKLAERRAEAQSAAEAARWFDRSLARVSE